VFVDDVAVWVTVEEYVTVWVMVDVDVPVAVMEVPVVADSDVVDSDVLECVTDWDVGVDVRVFAAMQAQHASSAVSPSLSAVPFSILEMSPHPCMSSYQSQLRGVS